MVQIGDIHIGKAQSAVTPSLNLLEAGLLWDILSARYSCVEETQIYHEYAHDPDFKVLLKFGVSFLEGQVHELEKQITKYQLTMPSRPPLRVNDADNTMVLTDQFMFGRIFEGCQTHIDYFARISRSTVTNDSLRKVLVDLLTNELALFDKLCKFGKTKGWLNIPPMYGGS